MPTDRLRLQARGSCWKPSHVARGRTQLLPSTCGGVPVVSAGLAGQELEGVLRQAW